MASASRAPVAVTGIGVLTSLGTGKADNWSRLTAGQSGIHAIRTRPLGGTLTVSSQERNAGALPFTSSTWKKKPCRWNG